MIRPLPHSSEFNNRAFDQLKKILKRYESSMKVLVEGPGVYYLAYKAQQVGEEGSETLFAALVIRKTGLNLYLSALKTFPGFIEFIPPGLMKYLSDDGLRFQFRNNISSLISEIEQLIKLSIGIL